MKKTTLALALLFAFGLTTRAQVNLINPVPQQVSTQGQTFDAPQSWRIVCDQARQGSIALQALKKASPAVDSKAKFTVTLGLTTDKAVKSLKKSVPAKAEGYVLKVNEKGVTIAAADETGLYYGVQSLLAMMQQGKLEACTVTDYPDVAWRGVVEGFYGTPWSHEARLSQFDFYGRHKMNVYIYGPKDDPYHREHWRTPYPEAEGQLIKELADSAHRCGVKFYWAIHPGLDIKWTDADRDALLNKFEQMYKLGVRAFAVFFDDISGEGTRAEKQAALLNYIDDNFVQKKHDVAPLVMCPTDYNKSWAGDGEKSYLRTLGAEMNKTVEVMWTGNSVVAPINNETMDWVNARIDRKGYVWWNFPVSDYVRDRILLGPVYGNDLDIASKLSGFVSNPMEHAEASKIALYGIADYTWNMKAYDYQADWERAIKELLPGDAAALRTFALYSKSLGQNGHGFDREEGDELKDVAASALKGEAMGIGALIQESMKLKMAADVLLTNKENAGLIKELRPWLLQAKNVADYGNAVCLMALCAQAPAGQPTFPTFEELYAQARSLQEQMYQLETSNVRHALQPGIKVATKVYLPTVNQLFTQAVDKYNAQHGTSLTNTAEYAPYKLESNVQQLANQPITVRSNDVSVSPSLEVINWQADGQLTITSEQPITFAGMDFNLGVTGVADKFRLELLVDGKWTPVSLLHYSDTDPVVHTGNELGGMTATALRLTNVSGQTQQVYFKRFNFVKQ